MGKSAQKERKVFDRRSCGVCGAEFVPYTYQQLNCSAECMREHTRRYMFENKARWQKPLPKEQRRLYHLRRYSMTPDEYIAMEEAQGGRCAICGVVPNKQLHVDHDHKCCPGDTSCGKCTRGLLCGPCNRGIAQLKDNPRIVLSALLYLEESL